MYQTPPKLCKMWTLVSMSKNDVGQDMEFDFDIYTPKKKLKNHRMACVKLF